MRLSAIRKNYTDDNIVYFEDYSIEKLLYCQKFLKNGMKNLDWQIDVRMIFEFIYLQKVKDIIDGASVNEYVKIRKS